MSFAARRLQRRLTSTDYKRVVAERFLNPDQKVNIFKEHPNWAASVISMGGGQLVEMYADQPIQGQLLYFHGGALRVPLNEEQLDFIDSLAQASHSKPFIADYPLLNEETDGAQIIQFAEEALEWLGEDGKTTTIVADSAGAWLAFYLLLTHDNLINSAILVSPWLNWNLSDQPVVERAAADVMLDIPTLRQIGKQFWMGLTDAQRQTFTQETLSVTSPVQILYGNDEMLVPDSEELADDLSENNPNVTITRFKDGFHDFILWPDLPETKKAINAMAEFLKDQRGVSN